MCICLWWTIIMWAIVLRFLIVQVMQLHDGVKKSGIMGSCDLCPGEPKQLSLL
uniref:DnaJ-like protein C11 C-terminal domain-containing protein n=1 Tax=Nelumbo nucifera TaxID=4432 RepID=A0A822ZWT0_NELNU|nr:TPA_asm: hypothetical protein HUJ06_017732 [Nelumbo nucifera]